LNIWKAIYFHSNWVERILAWLVVWRCGAIHRNHLQILAA